MKNIYTLLLLTLAFISCEDVIDVDVPSEEPRLTIDALIKIAPEDEIVYIEVKAKLSSSFFDEIQPAKLDQIIIQNIDKESNNTILLRESEDEQGVYFININREFLTEGRIVLGILYNEETYVAITEFVNAPVIDNLNQGDDSLFGNDETEIKISFTDLPDDDNYYLFDLNFDEYLLTEDIFYKNEQFSFSYFYDQKFQDNTSFEISLLGIDFPFYNYMNQILAQSGETQGPFQTPAGTVRGNIINVTDVEIDNFESIDDLENIVPNENYALGYFAICEEQSKTVIIQN
ncbi:DUF4249 family protein [Cellulophaga sp. HaHaR_3_176]|uniref:DUF4249 family protein n=1 Tax=Cellulophaga sp. HaHaR_3_176 TaxID=1942464 RepID=UPI001C1FA6C3|nr:DUF4249 family protein [Cellulophaga sp. HaHaR_3_176]QWX82583.1 DUF4249 family protein [Cellulophaga sp. HaHaR_3_176]